MGSPKLPDAVASAITSGDFAQFAHLYQLNSDIPLMKIAKHAAKYGQPQIMQWCCDQGWRPPRESFNDDFFLYAVDGASPAIFQILIDHGFNLNAQYSETLGDALACAVVADKYEFAKWLLDHGHRPTPEASVYGPSPFTWPMHEETNNLEMLKLLLDYGHDLEGVGVGVAAAEYGNLEALELLLDRGVDIEDANMSWFDFTWRELDEEEQEGDEPYESQGTALYRACRQGHVECVEFFAGTRCQPAS